MKRLVCSLDGTWNDDDGASPPTNVAKLNRAIRSTDGNGVKQLVRYVVGIATADNGGLTFLKGALGIEVGDRIKGRISISEQLLRTRRRNLSFRILARRLRGP